MLEVTYPSLTRHVRCLVHPHADTRSMRWQLANVMSTEALFYTCIVPFIAFFWSFAFVLYPLRDVLHPTGALSTCESVYQSRERECNICKSVILTSALHVDSVLPILQYYITLMGRHCIRR